MIFGHLQHPDAYAHLLASPVWQEAFDWLRELRPTARPGTKLLRNQGMSGTVQDYETLPREQCPFENHRHHLDIQYCIAGGEFIECDLVSRLEPATEYDAANDIRFYRPANGQTILHLLPGDFAVFYPSDAHRPKVSDGTSPRILKALVKINLGLLTDAK
jgi:biofilm protein TabA